MSDELGFDPAKVSYVQRYTKSGNKRKDGTQYPASGPYWYAHWIDNGSLRAKYLGKTLPEECIPYASPVVPMADIGRNVRAGRRKQTRRGANDDICAALDKGEQVVIDLQKIAEDCNAYINSLGNKRFVIYRDPKEKSGEDST